MEDEFMVHKVQLLDWLHGRAPHVGSAPPPLPPGVAVKPLETPDSPDLLDVPESPGRHPLGEIYAVMEYSDAGGQATRRRVTLMSLDPRSTFGYVHAVCHERRAYRCFRTDRIQCFIDQDGVVSSPRDFFSTVLGIDLVALLRDEAKRTATFGPPASDLSAQGTIRGLIHPAVAILVAAARSDDQFHREEMDRILHYVEDELLALEDEGRISFRINLDLLDSLAPWVRNMRPTRKTIDWAYPAVLRLPPSRRARFVRALEAVIVADGRFAVGEADFLDDLGISWADGSS